MIKSGKIFLFSFFISAFFVSCTFQKLLNDGSVAEKFESANRYFNKKEYDKASMLYYSILGATRTSENSQVVLMNYALCQYHLKDYGMASYLFNKFAETYITSDLRIEAQFYHVKSEYNLCLPYYLDQTKTEQVLQKLQAFINIHPSSKYISYCNDMVDELRIKLKKKAFNNAMMYYHLGSYQAAIHALESTISSYPDIEEKEEMEYFIVKSSYEYAIRSIESKKKERLEEVLNNFSNYKADYPEGKYYNKANDLNNLAATELAKLNKTINQSVNQ